MKTEVVEVQAFRTWLDPQGFVKTVLKNDLAEIGIEQARENTEAVIRVSQGRVYPLFVDARKIKSITKEARDHFSMRGRKGNASAIAILFSSPLSRIIGNFFLGLNKPTVPTKLFTTEEEAEKWLKGFSDS